MEYFLLLQNKKWIPDCKTLLRAYDHQKAYSFLTFKTINRFPDFVQGENWLISPKVKKLFELCCPDLLFQKHIFLDQQGKDNKLFYSMEKVPVYPVLSEMTKYRDRSTIAKLVLKPDINTSSSLFQIRTNTECFTIINTELAESLLKRNLYGYYLERVQVEGRVNLC